MVSVRVGAGRFAVVGFVAASFVAAVVSPVNAVSSNAPRAVVGAPMCLDIGNTRNNLDNAFLYVCQGGNANQKFVIDDGQVKVADTIGRRQEMCLDAGNSRNDLDNVFIYTCQTPNANQRWVVRDGQLVLKDTIGTRQEMCLDMGNSRNNLDNVFIYTCQTPNANQRWVVQRGYIKAEDTLS